MVGAGVLVCGQEWGTGVDTREWIPTTKRAHTFGLPVDHHTSDSSMARPGQNVPVSPLINPLPPDTLKYCPGAMALKYYNFAGPYLIQ